MHHIVYLLSGFKYWPWDRKLLLLPLVPVM